MRLLCKWGEPNARDLYGVAPLHKAVAFGQVRRSVQPLHKYTTTQLHNYTTTQVHNDTTTQRHTRHNYDLHLRWLCSPWLPLRWQVSSVQVLLEHRLSLRPHGSRGVDVDLPVGEVTAPDAHAALSGGETPLILAASHTYWCSHTKHTLTLTLTTDH